LTIDTLDAVTRAGRPGTALLTPVARSSLAHEVAKKLRREILTGNIKPGERILEQEISAMMKTSRGPVRDALIRLEHEGLVVREPNRSAVVASMTVDDVEEVCSLRLSLEMLALRYSMERAQEEDFGRLLKANELLRDCLASDFSLQKAVDLDLQFHEELVKSARHNRVLSMWRSIKPQIWFLIFSRNAFALENFQEAVRSHGVLVDQIQHKQPEEGRANLQIHLDIAYATLISLYTKIQDAEDVS
jgi:DNA-binding GntR family transcriptional regulator